jgi:hypothetical protein
MMQAFLFVEVAGADRPQQFGVVPHPKGENNEDRSPVTQFSNRKKPLFAFPPLRCGENGDGAQEKLFDVFPSEAMLAAFRPVAVIPIEAFKLHLKLPSKL